MSIRPGGSRRALFRWLRRSLMLRIGPIPLLDRLQYGRHGFEIPHYFAIRFVMRHDGDWKLDGMSGRCPLCHAAEGVDADVHA